MLNFNWNSIDESTFQGHLNKYTNAFKGYQTRHFVLDTQAKSLFYFMPEEVRKKGPRGMIELIDCWVSPSNEDDVTFTVQTGGAGEIFKLRASDAKERQKWIDKLRTYSGTNAANAFVSTLPIPKIQQTTASSSSLGNSPNETHMRPVNRGDSKFYHHQQTIKDLKEVIRCVEVNQREFVDTIDTIPDNVPLHPLSKEMLLLRSISQSCVNSLHDSLTILKSGRTPDFETTPIPVPSTPSPQPSTAIMNTSNRQLSPNSTSGRSSLTVGLSSQSTLFNSQNRTASLGAMSLQNETILSTRNLRMNGNSLHRLTESTQ